MWLITRYGFFAIAADGLAATVRARRRGHLEALRNRFPSIRNCRINLCPGHDYPWRMEVDQKVWAAVVSEMALEQDWVKVKPEIFRYQDANGIEGAGAFHSLIMRVWEMLYRFGDVETLYGPVDYAPKRPPRASFGKLVK